MATAIEVVLRETVNKLGKPGEVVRVKPGFARNYLLPRGLAVRASAANLRQVEHEKRLATKRSERLRADAEGVAEQLSQLTWDVPMRVGEGDRLFGALTAKDVAGLLHAKGHNIDKKQIEIPQPIKELGEHEVVVRLAPSVHATIKINIVRRD